jgi:hypothetical protein
MPRSPIPPRDISSPDVVPEVVPDVSLRWRERLARVRRSQARVDVTGMTRPPRDPDERAFLAARGQLGRFAERPNAALPKDVP